MKLLPHPVPEVVFCEVEDGAVLLSTTDELYFSLNGVGARVWALLPPACETVDDVCNVLRGEYPDVPANQIREDVETLLEELLRERLVRAA